MTELEAIAKNILGLKQLLRVAWEDLGSARLSSAERREIRNQMHRAASDLREALQGFQCEHDRLRKIHAEKCEKKAPRQVKLRLVDLGCSSFEAGCQNMPSPLIGLISQEAGLTLAGLLTT